jgi:hypothetical protein
MRRSDIPKVTELIAELDRLEAFRQAADGGLAALSVPHAALVLSVPSDVLVTILQRMENDLWNKLDVFGVFSDDRPVVTS